MARIRYDDPTATAYQRVREIPRDGLTEWRAAIRRHLDPSPGMTVADIGAGTGQFTAALRDWFGVDVLAVEPSAAMRERISRRPGVRVLAGYAAELPLADDAADGAWMSLMIHHIPDLAAAAREIRRVLRPGAPVLIRQGFPGRLDGIENVRWFPETARTVASYPTVEQTCAAFASAGFTRQALEPVAETYPAGLADYLGHLDTLRSADTSIRALTDEEFHRGKTRVADAVRRSSTEPRVNRLDLLILR